MAERWERAVLDAWREGQTISAVGPGPVAEHLEHARALARRIDETARRGLDLGTGAGIPGLALAGLRPDIEWVLVDAAQRRVRLVTAAVAAAGWERRVEVRHARAEDLPAAGYAAGFDVVVARLFGRPAVTAECAAPLLQESGQLLVTEPEVPDAGRWDGDGLSALGLVATRRWADPAVQELRRSGVMEARFPRKPGVASRRPLW